VVITFVVAIVVIRLLLAMANSPDAWRPLVRAAAYWREKRYQEAGAIYAQLVRRHPDQGTAWVGLARVQHRLHRYAEALEAWDRALAFFSTTGPDQYKMLAFRGNTLTAMHRDEEALAAFDQALTEAPRNAQIWTCKAQVLEHAGRHTEALQAVAMAQDAQAPWSTPYQRAWAAYIAADALNGLGRHAEALEAALRALARPNLGIDTAHARLAQATALRALGRLTEAQTAAEQGLVDVARQVAEDPNDESTWTIKAGLLRVLGREADAAAAAAHAQALIAG
jgi:tetratricopeptide (TPR) repeat protein